ncbi:MAG: Sir2 family NAD-dependent protein deacetylase [Chloroflexota bacterium]|nr:Sir2 family NAD-dependent protein deacetylase [Chloroflexota bacterium]
MNSDDLNKRIEALAQWMLEAKKLVVFTGAGISTDSGLSDFRGPEGLWTRKAKGLPTEKNDFAAAEPNSAHSAIVELQRLGKLDFLISQNVDNLHLRSGIDPDLLAELHGNLSRLRCTGCGFVLDNFDDMESCPLCGGRLVSSVVDFGQALPQTELDRSYRHTQECDLFIVVGSSLVITPAADIPRLALEYGSRLVIINRGETPLDDYVHLKFEERIDRVLPTVIARLKERLS